MSNAHFTEQDRFDWLRLARTPRIGPVTFHQLIHRFGSATAALEALPDLMRNRRPLRVPAEIEIENELRETAAYGAQILCSCEPLFPNALAEISPPPPVLTMKGVYSLADRPAIAIVGARNASAAGRKLARDIAAILGCHDYVIASGMARGIDEAAHSASLPTGTIAVLGGGVDHAYPKENEALHNAISRDGLVVSESRIGYRAQARDFPRRNRLITGLSAGVVVIEAAERSGSLISARTATEQGREVMAVPGSPLDPRSAGSNRLLRDGATLVRNAEDVLEAINRLDPRAVRAPASSFETAPGTFGPATDDQLQQVRSAMSLTPMPIDDIADVARISAALCAAILVELELNGEVETHFGGTASLACGEEG